MMCDVIFTGDVIMLYDIILISLYDDVILMCDVVICHVV